VTSPYKRVLLKLSGEVFGGGRVGVDPDVVAGLAQQIATVVASGVQVAAMRPKYLTRDEVPSDVVERERSIAEATSREEGKPEQALPKIIEGRLNGFFKDVALLDQPSVQDSKKSVKAVLDQAGVTVKRFVRFEVGA
jgi:elongation factor Ts